ncbi:MAG: GWxTD domain-containing protein [candidate division WOR-3 bacterium]|nr:GWxTD domain-containing protein [candidate division WOR-3 bacterium]MDW7988393.1 GWxTD domain-containing protein [candidate division WOR-3 bacterium]
MWKINLLIFSIIFISISLLYAEKLSVDWANFKYSLEKNDTLRLSLVEVYFSAPYYEFDYQVENETIVGRYHKEIFIKNIMTEESISETANHRIILPSFQVAESKDLKVLDIYRFIAQPGRYLLKLTITVLPQAHKTLSYLDTIEITGYSDKLALSDITLASLIVQDTIPSKFTKGGVKIIPNPDGKFGKAYAILYAYLEGYNLIADTNFYELKYRILNRDQMVIKELPAEKINKSGKNFAHTFALNTQGLPPDEYLLEVTLKDLSTGNETKKLKEFFILEPTTAVVTKELPFDLQEAEAIFKVVAYENEIKHYEHLNKKGKIEYLRRYWRARDFSEIKNRVRYADENYKVGRILGRATDRGKIYIKYGKPDEVVIHTMVEHTKPHEHWYYYQQGLQFIFVDIRGDSNFRLIYTNSTSEVKPPNWEKYIDPLELEDLQ